MKTRHVTGLVLAAAAWGCGTSSASGGSAAPSPDRLSVTSGAGGVGSTELHNDAGVSLHRLEYAADAVWGVLPGVYERLGIAGAGAVPAERLYGARNFRARRIEGERLSSFIDCGMGPTATPRADEYDVRMTVVTRVFDDEGGTSRIETTVEAVARPRGVSGNAVDCASRGSLESRIASLVTLALLEPGGEPTF